MRYLREGRASSFLHPHCQACSKNSSIVTLKHNEHWVKLLIYHDLGTVTFTMVKCKFYQLRLVLPTITDSMRSPQGWPSGHYHSRSLCGQEGMLSLRHCIGLWRRLHCFAWKLTSFTIGCHHSSCRLINKSSPIRLCPGRRH